MTEHTTHLNLPYPDGNDAPDGPGAVAALALALDGIFESAAWTPAVTGRTVTQVKNNQATRIGNLVLATAQFKMNGPIADGMFLYLPYTSARFPGLPLTVGDIDFISADDNYTIWRGLLLSANDKADRAAFAVDVSTSGRNGQITTSAINPATNSPFPTAVTGDFFVNVRLQYAI